MNYVPNGKRQFPKELTAGQTIDFGSMDINASDVGGKRIISIEPSTRPIAGSPSLKINEVVKYKPTSSYGHINLTSYSNERNHKISKLT